MSEQNIIPNKIYPPLPTAPPEDVENFRLKKICDCQKELEQEINHYKKVCKKYKRLKAITHTTSTMTGFLSVALSSTGLAVSLSGMGIVVGAPIVGFANLSSIISTAFIIGNKNINKKISKHEKTISLAEAKHLTISRLISKAMNDRRISDSEFDLILREVEQYHSMKKELRIKQEKIEIIEREREREALKKQIKEEYQKKLGSLVNIKN